MLRTLLTIIVASFLIGLGVNGFVLPSRLVNGGIWGISLLANYTFGFQLAITFVCLNLPIYFIAIKYDLNYFFKGLVGTLISAIGINLLFPISGFNHLPLLANVVLGGLFIGTGVGMMLRIHASPGGVDLLALIISKWLSINVGIVILCIDALIILTAVLILKDEKMLYSLIIVTIVGVIASIMTSIKSIRVYS
ncbi:YitT family protein [Bacillus sp. CGMCC 1.16607]|uniref:YitT family protein n=1 Tax=Bacillus sp. CGMCC 1.16607 TaxID=3351842 RepID=UPI00363F5157